MGEIIREKYPQLNKVLWDYHKTEISAEDAFHMYEGRWRFIDYDNMGNNEKELLENLINFFGNGLFMAA